MNYIPAIEYTDAPIRITFGLPPKDDFRNESLSANARTTTSTGGVDQTQYNYTRETRLIEMTFVEESVKQAFETFFKDHASRGLEFKYFESEDEVDFITVTMDKFEFKPVILFPGAVSGEYIYEFSFSIRRTL
jgi:hypothetical protein